MAQENVCSTLKILFKDVKKYLNSIFLYTQIKTQGIKHIHTSKVTGPRW